MADTFKTGIVAAFGHPLGAAIVKSLEAALANLGHRSPTPLAEVFLAAGLKALEQQGLETRWIYLRVLLPPEHVNNFLTGCLRPALSVAGEKAGIKGWWWLRKWDDSGPHLRLRIEVDADDTEPVITYLIGCFAV